MKTFLIFLFAVVLASVPMAARALTIHVYHHHSLI